MFRARLPDRLIPALPDGLQAAGLLRDLHHVLDSPLIAVRLPLHHPAVVLGTDLPLCLPALSHGQSGLALSHTTCLTLQTLQTLQLQTIQTLKLQTIQTLQLQTIQTLQML